MPHYKLWGSFLLQSSMASGWGWTPDHSGFSPSSHSPSPPPVLLLGALPWETPCIQTLGLRSAFGRTCLKTDSHANKCLSMLCRLRKYLWSFKVTVDILDISIFQTVFGSRNHFIGKVKPYLEPQYIKQIQVTHVTHGGAWRPLCLYTFYMTIIPKLPSGDLKTQWNTVGKQAKWVFSMMPSDLTSSSVMQFLGQFLLWLKKSRQSSCPSWFQPVTIPGLWLLPVPHPPKPCSTINVMAQVSCSLLSCYCSLGPMHHTASCNHKS